MKRRKFVVASAGLVGAAAFSKFSMAASSPCPPGQVGLDGGSSVSTSCAAGNPAADWQSRISGPGVIWYHNFDSQAEVRQFQWKGGVGNDPTGAGDTAVMGSPSVVWVPTGGADGGGYMQITHPAGVSPNRKEVGQWWRPFSPMNAASNGRNQADPCGAGANNPRPDGSAITPLAFAPTQGGGQTVGWAAGARPGWYGNIANANSKFDGTDFYIQLRVMADPRRTAAGMGAGGKFPWITITSSSNPNQELVTVQAYVEHNTFTGPGQSNYHMMYSRNGNFTFEGIGGGTAIQVGHDGIGGVCDPYSHVLGGCWNYATNGTWDTLLYHVSPGTSGSANTHLEVWAAHQGETTYRKLWDVMYDAAYDVAGNDLAGWNALLLTAYNNGYEGSGGVDTVSQFWTRYDQVIFSKQPIPCPQA